MLAGGGASAGCSTWRRGAAAAADVTLGTRPPVPPRVAAPGTSSILHTLRVRYALDSIYTYSGNILIAVRGRRGRGAGMLAAAAAAATAAACRAPSDAQHPHPPASPARQANPHKRLRQLYGGRMMAQYRGVPLGELSPHVYAIAEQVRQPGGWLGAWRCTATGGRCRPAGWRRHSSGWTISLLAAAATTTRLPPAAPPRRRQAYAAMMMDEQRQAILIRWERRG